MLLLFDYWSFCCCSKFLYSRFSPARVIYVSKWKMFWNLSPPLTYCKQRLSIIISGICNYYQKWPFGVTAILRTCFGPWLFQSNQRSMAFKCVFICVNLWSVICSLQPLSKDFDSVKWWVLKAILFFHLELFTLCECEHYSKLVDDQSVIAHQRTADLFFHVILPNLHYFFFICLIRLCFLVFDVDRGCKFACKQNLHSIFLPVQHLKINSSSLVSYSAF